MEENTVDFMDLRLIPGQVFQLEFDGYTSQRERSVLIGYRRGGSMLVTTPIINGVSASVKNGERVNVRFFAGKKSAACAFQTEVIYASKSPYPHIHLKIPDGVITGEVRRSVRADVEVITKIEYFVDNEPKETSAKIVDLSMNGARMIGRTFDFDVDADLLLTFRIDVTEIEMDLKIKARVRSINAMENGFTVGLQFEALPPNEMIALQAFVLSRINEL